MNPAAHQPTDAQLLERTRAGDMSAYDELYRRHVSDARRVARIVTDDGEEAEDVVAEAFTRVLARLREGSGPDDVLTPYLRTVVRRLAVDRHRASSRAGQPADPALLAELPTADDEIARTTDRQLVRAAYESLPERWQRVLWHTEIEGRPAAALTPALGSSANAVAALAYRAREGLRQAFLAVHLAASAPAECRPIVPKLAAYIRQSLPEEEDVAVAIHLDTCAHCRERRDELLLLVSDVRSVLAPALLGMLASSGGFAATGTAGTTAAGAGVGSAGAGAAESPKALGAAARFRPRGFAQVAATSVVSAAAAAAVAFAAISAISPPSQTGEPEAAPPPMTSEQQSATNSPLTTTRTPSPEPTTTPSEPPDPTEEPAEDDDNAPQEISRALTEPSAAAGQDESSSADDASAQPARPAPRSNPSKDEKDKNASEADSGTKPVPDTTPPGSKDKPGNKNPGKPPPSPWACDVLPQLPWCD